jgi:uncharacterized protein YfkK (UPF0435 family)
LASRDKLELLNIRFLDNGKVEDEKENDKRRWGN